MANYLQFSYGALAHMSYNIALHISDEVLRQIIAEQLAYIEQYNICDFNVGEQNYDLLIIDLDTPCFNSIAQPAHAAIIALATQPATQKFISQLPFSISDYILKPFRLSQLLSRISMRSASINLNFSCGDYQFDASKEVFLNGNGQMIKLTTNESKIITYLYNHKDRIVAKSELISYAVPESPNISFYRLREKLADSAILTSTSEGYRLNV